MNRNITRTAHFRLASLYATVFSLSVLILGMILYVTIPQMLETQLRHRIDADMQQLLGDYYDDGMEELRHDIRERIENNRGNRLRYSITNTKGRVIFDRLQAIPHKDGWHKTEQDMLLRVHHLDDEYRLVVGGDIRPIRQIKDTMLRGFLLAFIATLCLGILGGVWVSARFLRRLEALHKTSIAIGAGDLSQRIAISRHKDDFDDLALMMNQMLDKIEQLMMDVKQGATNIAHDLRTPLSRLRTHLESMRDEIPTRQSLSEDDLNDAIAQLDNVLDSFSALMRMAELRHADKTKLFSILNISDLAKHVASAFEAVIEETGGVLDVMITPDIMVTGDRALLMQLVSNVLDNAVKYSGPAPHIEISVKQHEGRKILSVRDHGPGIPQDEYNHVIKPFYRLDHSRNTDGHGLGLGLVKAIADMHHATISFEDAKPGLRVNIIF